VGAERDEDIDAEVRSHLQMTIRERIEQGEDPEAAKRRAVKEFGNLTLTKDSMRRIWRGWWFDFADDLLQDVRYAVRLLTHSPAFSSVVIIVLALGISANAAVFGLFKAAFIKPLPGVDQPNNLAVIVARTTGGQTTPLSYPDYEYVRDHAARAVSASGASW
jgi:hypothetical protein